MKFERKNPTLCLKPITNSYIKYIILSYLSPKTITLALRSQSHLKCLTPAPLAIVTHVKAFVNYIYIKIVLSIIKIQSNDKLCN